MAGHRGVDWGGGGGGEGALKAERSHLGRLTFPRFFFNFYVSENAFQAILKPIFPYSIISIFSRVRHSNTLFLTISFAFPCRPLGALVMLDMCSPVTLK